MIEEISKIFRSWIKWYTIYIRKIKPIHMSFEWTHSSIFSWMNLNSNKKQVNKK